MKGYERSTKLFTTIFRNIYDELLHEVKYTITTHFNGVLVTQIFLYRNKMVKLRLYNNIW